MDLEIRHLRVVAAVAEAGSISRAAAALGHTQPAITAQLQRIERVLGSPLFTRNGSGARPTALGSIVLAHAQNILALHDDLMRDVRRRDPDDGDLSTLRLGSTPSPLTAAMVIVARELLPGTEVSLHLNETSEELLELLTAGRLEFGLGTDYPGYELPLPAGLDEALLTVHPIFVVLSKDHPLARRAEVPLEALANEQWLPGEGKDVRMRAQFREACQRAGFTPRRVQRVHESIGFSLIGRGHGVALGHPLTVERDNAVVRPLAGDPMWVRQRLIWPTRGTLADHAPSLRDALMAAHRATAEKSPRYRAWLKRRA
jgi:DNA-binding transcriptional LysR family regulator